MVFRAVTTYIIVFLAIFSVMVLTLTFETACWLTPDLFDVTVLVTDVESIGYCSVGHVSVVCC